MKERLENWMTKRCKNSMVCEIEAITLSQDSSSLSRNCREHNRDNKTGATQLSSTQTKIPSKLYFFQLISTAIQLS